MTNKKSICGNCQYWKHWNRKQGFGECRRYPPQGNYDGSEQRLEPVWPETNMDNWCGEHQLRANLVKEAKC